MKKIIIVEDDQDISFVLKYALQKENYEVIQAFDGVDAMEKIKNNLPDLIILDIMLPKMDGYSVNLKLKDNEKTKNIPVVVITGKGNFREFIEANNEMTVTAYFEKPFPVALLIEKIKDIFSTSQENKI